VTEKWKRTVPSEVDTKPLVDGAVPLAGYDYFWTGQVVDDGYGSKKGLWQFMHKDQGVPMHLWAELKAGIEL
jgi:hypothetical protein